MSYTVIKKMYRTVKDMECGNAYKTLDMTKGLEKPLSQKEAETVKSKMVKNPLWTYTVVAI